jgi:argininosuccinate lyase
MNDLAQKFNHIQKLYESGTISQKEYAVLIVGLDLDKEISANAKQLQKKGEIYDAMIKALALAKTIM